MVQILKNAAVGIVAFVVLDGVWLGLIMKTFYRDALAPIARMSNGALAPIWPAAAVVYVLLGAGTALFVVPRATSLASAALFGAGFGIVVYGVYDLTNFSTLANWPAAVTVADIAWGAVASAVAAMAVFTIER
jgi:uncharacterized membrane protein